MKISKHIGNDWILTHYGHELVAVISPINQTADLHQVILTSIQNSRRHGIRHAEWVVSAAGGKQLLDKRLVKNNTKGDCPELHHGVHPATVAVARRNMYVASALPGPVRHVEDGAQSLPKSVDFSFP